MTPFQKLCAYTDALKATGSRLGIVLDAAILIGGLAIIVGCVWGFFAIKAGVEAEPDIWSKATYWPAWAVILGSIFLAWIYDRLRR